MAQTRGDHAVKGDFVVGGNGKFEKGLDSSYLEIVDSKASGVPGGTFTGHDPGEAAWRTRDLVEVIHDDFSVDTTVSDTPGAGGDITLGKGVYYAEISTPAFNVNEHVARLADVTDNPGAQANTVILGTTEFAADTALWITGTDGDQTVGLPIVAGSGQTRSQVTGRFQLFSQRTLEVQHRCANTQVIDGFGSDGAFYETNNIFTIVKMWQVRDDI